MKLTFRGFLGRHYQGSDGGRSLIMMTEMVLKKSADSPRFLRIPRIFYDYCVVSVAENVSHLMAVLCRKHQLKPCLNRISASRFLTNIELCYVTVFEGSG